MVYASMRYNKNETDDEWLKMRWPHLLFNSQDFVAQCTTTSAEKNDTKFTFS